MGRQKKHFPFGAFRLVPSRHQLPEGRRPMGLLVDNGGDYFLSGVVIASVHVAAMVVEHRRLVIERRRALPMVRHVMTRNTAKGRKRDMVTRNETASVTTRSRMALRDLIDRLIKLERLAPPWMTAPRSARLHHHNALKFINIFSLAGIWPIFWPLPGRRRDAPAPSSATSAHSSAYGRPSTTVGEARLGDLHEQMIFGLIIGQASKGPARVGNKADGFLLRCSKTSGISGVARIAEFDTYRGRLTILPTRHIGRRICFVADCEAGRPLNRFERGCRNARRLWTNRSRRVTLAYAQE
jgi:hypothetical protein